MSKLPEVSVIIPCYNHQQYLSNCLQSLEENEVFFEVIVIDDGSEPEVFIPKGQWPFEIKLIRTNNQGLSKARNEGIKHSVSQKLLFLDADDELLPGCLDILSSHTSKNTFSSAGYRLINKISNNVTDVIPAYGDISEALLQLNPAPPHCYMYSRSMIEDIRGFYDGERVNGGHEDYDLLIRLAIKGYLNVQVKQVLVKYFKRAGSMSSHTNKMHVSRLKVWQEHLGKFLEFGTANILGAAISGFIRHLYSLPEELKPTLYKSIPLICKYLNEFGNQIPTSEVTFFLDSISSIENSDTKELIYHLRRLGTQDRVVFDNQAVIDRRVGMLANYDRAHWLCYSSLQLLKLNQPYAIYGAGILGQMLVDKLRSVDSEPVIFVDKKAEMGEFSLQGINVVSLDTLNKTDIKNILIASHTSYEVIKQNIKAKCPTINILDGNERCQK